ncbi:YihY family inner membrane protein [Alkalibaculum sp. M08DMB]|uniref:YihY family inner membrane protein n=1 Tax=Alkalibaculum sporogenes TaxID=2655001 RepID=A0A6A7KCU4_9FIRM|nr:YihY/virulence factor BrkB family protein [Alkalibaculum sporogenes]MPW27264.1 YihY family inner membrane protein [Alkalibaculum sporogenes]
MKFKLFLKYIYNEYTKSEFGSLSAQTSYFLLLSFIPFLIFFLTIIGNLNLPSDDIYHYLESILPTQSYTLISNILSEVLNTESVNLVSLFLTFFLASKGVRAIVLALNKAYIEDESRNIFYLWFISIIFTLIFSFILVMTLLLLVFGKLLGEIIFNNFAINFELVMLWNYIRYIVTVISMILVFSFIYKHAPNCKSCKLTFKDIIIGSIFTTISWTVTSLVFAYYVNNFNTSYVSLYGSLGGVFALLVWLYMSSSIIILGGQINAYLYKFK